MKEKTKSDKKSSSIGVSRRLFMKKMVYKTPKIIALGLLMQGKPASAFDTPPDGPS